MNVEPHFMCQTPGAQTIATSVKFFPANFTLSPRTTSMRNIVILGGSSHPTLTKSICTRLGVAECKVLLGKFSNGETSVQIQESVRGKDVFIITTGAGEINEILMELFIMLSACKTASAKRNNLLSSLASEAFWGCPMGRADVWKG